MNKMDLWCALGQLDDELISAAARTRKEENIIMMHTKKPSHLTRSIALIAAVAAVFAALGITAYATDLFGIKSRLLDKESQYGTEAATLSLAGGQDTPDYRAAAEWEAFQAEYYKSGKVDSDSLKTGYATAGDAQRAGAYFFYGCQDVTMIETLQEIAQRYGLLLHTEMTPAQDVQTLVDAGIGNIFPSDTEFTGYLYEDGSYIMAALGENAGVSRSVRGTMAPYIVVIQAADTYTEEEYVTECGETVQLMYSETCRRGIAMYETEKSVFHLDIRAFTEDEILSMDVLKSAVDRYDLTRLDG